VGRHPRAKTGVTFVSVADNGDRSFLFFRHPSADQMITVDDVDPALVARARVVHLGSSTLSREPARAATWKALAVAREAGRLISTDPNWRPHLWDDPAEARAHLARLVAGAHLVKVSDDELPPIAGTADVEAGARRLRELGAELVVVTLGARGCYFDAPAGSGYVAGVPARVVDTTGAGDGFVAGLWSVLLPLVAGERQLGSLERGELERACAAGNRLGARVVTELGATSAYARGEP
jgi:fructokinase